MGDGFMTCKWFQMKKTSKFNKDFIKTTRKTAIKDYQVDFVNPKNLRDLHNDFKYLLERIRIKKYNEFVCNLYDKNNYAVHIKTFKTIIKIMD